MPTRPLLNHIRIYQHQEINMATFSTIGSNHRFTFINYSNSPIQYDLGRATGGYIGINGKVNPGHQVTTNSFGFNGTLEQGNVPVVTISGAPTPGFRFWSGSGSQYINVLAGNGYTVTKDTSEISEVTGNGFSVTVDAGGKGQNLSNIYIQIYNSCIRSISRGSPNAQGSGSILLDRVLILN
jgi:hypothetical protein